jgi:hypothetical protein
MRPPRAAREKRMQRAALATVFVAVALGLASGATAGSADRARVSFTPADLAAAKAAVLRPADLGSAGGWTGGTRKPDLSSTMHCAGYTPKQSDLVVTGAAETVYHHTGLELQSAAQVMRTRAMVAHDWSRTVTAPRAFGCLRTMLARALPAGEKLVSFTHLAFPRLTQYAAADRAVIDVSSGMQHAQVVADVVVVGRSRTELTLSIEAPASARGGLLAAETRLAKALLARVRA